MTESQTASGRPRRQAAENALYKPCPACEKKFLVTEIEFHANLCIMKLERQQTAKSSPKSVRTSPKAPVKKEPPHNRKIKEIQSKTVYNKLKSVPYAPEFRPTFEEFQNPLQYINSIRDRAQRYGICKIIPPAAPEQWLGDSFDKVLEPDDFVFQTKKQNIREVARRGASDNFYCKLAKFMEKSKSRLVAYPRIEGKKIPLYQLYKAVTSLGGYYTVTSNKSWEVVCQKMGITSTPLNCESVRTIYFQNLLLYENSKEKFDIKTNSPLQPSLVGMRAVQGPIKSVFATSTPPASIPAPQKPKNKKKKKKNDSESESEESDDEFGFESGKQYSINSFKRHSNRFLKNWFNITATTTEELSYDIIEAEFWDIVDNHEDDCIVYYGSDLDVKSHGSAFPNDSKSNWNLNILPTLQQSLLRYLPEHISGITIPMMYVGMLFSCFCWHTEDNYLYSINYLHTGAAKTWYGVGSEDSAIFEKVMKDSLPDLFENQPDLLHHLITMLSPIELMDNGVPIVRIIQNPGEFVVTFPQAYHAGYNNGFNIAEAVNFASPDWLPFGNLCVTNYKLVKRTHVFSHHELIYNAILQEKDPFVLGWLLDAFQKAREAEINAKEYYIGLGITKCQSWNSSGPLPHARPCKLCNTECYFSSVSCSCKKDFSDICCPEHVQTFCSCPITERVLLVRHPMNCMDLIVERTNQILSASSPLKKRLEPPPISYPAAKRNCCY